MRKEEKLIYDVVTDLGITDKKQIKEVKKIVEKVKDFKYSVEFLKTFVKNEIKKTDYGDYWHIPAFHGMEDLFFTEYLTVVRIKGWNPLGVFLIKDKFYIQVEFHEDEIEEFSKVVKNPFFGNEYLFVFYILYTIAGKEIDVEKLFRFVTGRKEERILTDTLNKFKEDFVKIFCVFIQKKISVRFGDKTYSMFDFSKTDKFKVESEFKTAFPNQVISFHNKITGGKPEFVLQKIELYKRVNQVLRGKGAISNRIILSRIESKLNLSFSEKFVKAFFDNLKEEGKIQDFEYHYKDLTKYVDVFYSLSEKETESKIKIMTPYVVGGVVIAYYINPYYIKKCTGYFMKGVSWSTRRKQVEFKFDVEAKAKETVKKLVQENIEIWKKLIKEN